MYLVFKIFRKAAYIITGGKEGSEEGIIVVGNDNLQKFVGRPKFTSDRLYEVTPRMFSFKKFQELISKI